MLNKPTRYSLFLGLSIATGTQYISAQETTEETDSTQTVKVEIVADTISANESLGKTVITKDVIQQRNTGNSTINDIAYTMPNVQFSDTYNVLDEDSILDIRPSNISISGGHYYENNFIVDGIGTNTLQDAVSNNLYAVNGTSGHPQTVFVNPQMIESVTVYDSNIPASYGGFTGGVFEVKTKDPSGEFHSGFNFGFETDDTTSFNLVAPEDFDPEEDTPEKVQYTKLQYGAYTEAPITDKAAVLFEYSRQESKLKNQQSHIYYSSEEHSATSFTENYKAKVNYQLNDETTLKVGTIYSPSEMEDHYQGLRSQKSTSWQHTAELRRETDNSILEITTGYQSNDGERKSPPHMYVYRNTESTDWVSSNLYMAYLGGYGNIETTEEHLPVKANYTLNLTDTAKINIGAEYVYEHATKSRPEASYAYGIGGVMVDSRIVSADGPDDLTVIDGEQAFTERTIYQAFEASATINNIGSWVEYSNEHSIAGTKLSYRLGLRYDYEDFLEGNNFAPRMAATWTPIEWMDVTVGWNRYYAGNTLAYKMEELEPGDIDQIRTYTVNESGQYVFSSDDWETESISHGTKYSQEDVVTPYNDEFTVATVFKGFWGNLKLQYLDRKGKDEFRQSEIIWIDGDWTNRKWSITNDGYSDYEAFTFEWTKEWKNHTFNINSTISKAHYSNNTYFESYEDDFKEVYYNGEVITKDQLDLIRQNLGSPDYVNLNWTSYWLKDNRLSVTLNGRIEFAYDTIRKGSYIRFNGKGYYSYEDYRVSDRYTFNLNTTWVAYESDYGTVSLYVKVRNLFNDTNESGDIEDYAYYEEGRSVWFGFSYDF
jgi:hypothetical protein